MSARPLLALAGVAALAACSKTSAPSAGLNLSEPSAVAVFRGYAAKYPTLIRPYTAIASTSMNELAIVDGGDNTMVRGPFPLRGLVYPVPDRPARLAAASLGDDFLEFDAEMGVTRLRPRPDLLVAVSSGASSLQVIRTWATDGDVVGEVDLRPPDGGPGGDVLALEPLAPRVRGTAQVVAVLSGRRVAVATFRRVGPGAMDPNAIDTTFEPTSPTSVQVRVSAQLPFQPVAIARSPATPGRVWVASRDELPGGIQGVAALDLDAMESGTLPAITVVNALAPTRLVGAAMVAEALAPAEALTAPVPPDPDAVSSPGIVNAFKALTPVERVYAVLDESACGLDAAIACGLVALDPGSGLLPDPVAPSTTARNWPDSIVGQAPWRPPLPIPGPLAMATSGPPAVGLPGDPVFADTTVMRMIPEAGARATSAVAVVASSDGTVWYVDLARWELPGHRLLQSNMSVAVASSQPSGLTGPARSQWLVLLDPATATTIRHTNPNGLSSAVFTTPGYTPTETWTIVREGVLPNLSLRKAEVGSDGNGLWLAVQTPGGNGGVVRVWDPTLDIRPGDIVVIDPAGLGTCGEFEAEVASTLEPPSTVPNAPGGRLRLVNRAPGGVSNPTWDQCLQRLGEAVAAPGSSFGDLLVTIRAGSTGPTDGYLLYRGTGISALAVGRPEMSKHFSLIWGDESPGVCTLPPAFPWPGNPLCDAACRDRCHELVKFRNARRIGYVPETCAPGTTCNWNFPNPSGPALGFILALEAGAAVPVPRDLTIQISTSDGRVPFRTILPTGATNDARAVVPFDRSPWNPVAGVRFLVPYPAGYVLDGSPSEGQASNELK